jgi:tetratricopeptide (TPR) repeat protein
MQLLTSLLAALLITCAAAFSVTAEEERSLDDLFAELQSSEEPDARRVEELIWQRWSQSGSPAMDMLLQRGRQAMDAGDYEAAINHLTALTDHAPDFAEGWNARATAFFYVSRYGEAVDDIAKTLTLNPRHFGAMTGLAFIYDAMEKPKEALKLLREVARLNPHQEGLEEQIRYMEKAAGEEQI